MTKQLKCSIVVAQYTFREILKSRIVINVIFLGFLLGVISYIASEFTFGVPARIALDFGLGTLHLTTNMVSLFLGVGLVAQEVESRTVYMILSRPVGRAYFLLGKIMGMIWIQFLNFAILGGMSISIYLAYGGSFNSLILWTFLFTLLESILVLLLVIFFSLIVNKVIAICNTFILIIFGHVLNDTKVLTFFEHHSLMKGLLNFYGYVFPNFYKLNLKDYVLYEQTMPPAYLYSTLAYVVSYLIFIVLLSCAIFNKKNLD